MKKDLISLENCTPDEVFELIALAEDVKKTRGTLRDDLSGKSVGLVFQKPSNRTRVSFEVGVYELGGKSIYLGPKEIALGKRESTSDVAQTLSRYLSCIVARTNSNQDIVDLAKYANVPVINALCDLYHPCQALADVLTIKEHFQAFHGINVAYIGDGNNVCHSLMLACGLVGLNIRVATPKGYEPNSDIVEKTKTFMQASDANIIITNDPKEATQGAHVIYSDVWVSMGQEEEEKKRLQDFEGFQINQDLVSLADRDYIFMHCLPAHRGIEVTADVIDGSKSVIFDQAENRLHAQKAVLIKLVGGK